MFIFAGVEMFHKILEEGFAGDQVGALVRGVKKDEISRGMILAKPGTVKLQDNLETQVKKKNSYTSIKTKPICKNKVIYSSLGIHFN